MSGDVRSRHRARGPRPALDADQDVLRLLDGLRRARPTRQTCPVCQGMPGTLPVHQPARGRVRRSRRRWRSAAPSTRDNRFARKHYFYPDLPKDYQISQYDEPLAEHGHLDLEWAAERAGSASRASTSRRTWASSSTRAVSRRRSRARSTSTAPACRSWRSSPSPTCAPPRRRPPTCARSARIVVYLGVCDGNMEEGSMRCDANVSLRPRGAAEFGTKVEIKNMNSFRNVQHALEYEIKRQARALDTRRARSSRRRASGIPTRAHTVSMRSKEHAHDYRYFPEPDLPPLDVEPRWVEAAARDPARAAGRPARALHGGPRAQRLRRRAR